MPEFTVRVRIFRAEMARLGPLKLEALRVVEEKTWRESGDPLETLAAVADAHRGKAGYVEIEVLGLDKEPRVVVLGVSPQYEGRKPLFPRPARLLRIGVLRESVVRARGFDEKGYAEIRVEDDIEWVNVDSKLYVFEGVVEAEQDVMYVIVDTEYGRKWVRVYPRLILRQASQQPQQQASQAPQSEQSLNGDSSREE